MMPAEYFMNSTAKKEGGRGEERGGGGKKEWDTNCAKAALHETDKMAYHILLL